MRTYFGFKPDSILPTIEDSLNGELGGVDLVGFFGNLIKNYPGDVRVIRPPGSDVRYSGGGYTVLQLVIEEVTGQSFASYMKEHVLEPLGMHASSFEWSADLRPNTATAYHGSHGKTATPNYLYTAKAAAGLYTTSHDVGVFLASFMADAENRIVLPETQHIMFDSGLGVWPTTVAYEMLLLENRGYNIGAWHSAYQMIPEQQAGIAVLTNGSHGDHVISNITEQWVSWVLARVPSVPENALNAITYDVPNAPMSTE